MSINSLPSAADTEKARQLSRHKALATGLFLLMVLIYCICTFYLKNKFGAWVGYVNAFAEAGMVGALADWFAVTALFHYPLGLRIPHTNLIQKSKEKIGNNLGNFVVSNFLNAATIRPYFEKIKISEFISTWLSKEKNTALLIKEISWLAKDILQKTDEKAVIRFITHQSKSLLNDIHLNELVANGLEIIISRGDHERILNYLLDKGKVYIANNEELVKQRVKQESHFLVPGFVDNIIASRLTKGAINYLTEIEADSQHKIRLDLLEQLNLFVANMKTSEKWKIELQGMKNSLLAGDKINEYATAIWESFKNNMIDGLTKDDTAVKRYMQKSISKIADNLDEDAGLRNKIDSWIRATAYKYLLKNVDTVGSLISNTIGNWEGKELSNKLELEVGKDLQYIRMNGTLVGGLVGLLIYTITHLINK